MTGAELLVSLGLAAATFVGAVAQRSTGMGFALLASPFLVLALGPLDGILVVNVCGSLSALLNLTHVWRDVDWPRVAILTPMGVLGVLPGSFAVLLLPSAPLTVAISLIVLLGLASTLLLRGRTLPSSRPLAAAGGLASGFMNVTAGVGGPGVVIYARATGWEHHRFAASAQVHFLVLGIVSLAAKHTVPALSVLNWSVLATCLLLGLAAGSALARRVDGQVAMRLVLVLAAAGGLLALVRGLLSLG